MFALTFFVLQDVLVGLALCFFYAASPEDATSVAAVGGTTAAGVETAANSSSQ
jgi:hypothetical protein